MLRILDTTNGKVEKFKFMDDKEYEILDELYFVTSFKDLFKALSYSEIDLKFYLKQLMMKDWVRVYKSPDEEIGFVESEFDNNYMNYCYLATKEGLKAHNSTS